MGLPSEDRAPGALNGTFYNDNPSLPKDNAPLLSNGALQSSRPAAQQRQGSGGDASSNGLAERAGKAGAKDRRPSGQQRMCGKCEKQLTGQFVRALGATYHLECFTCHVRNPPMFHDIVEPLTNQWGDHRTATKSSPRNSSPSPNNRPTNTRSARPTTSAASTCYAINAVAPSAALTSPPSSTSITSSISPAASAPPSSARRTLTTNMKGVCTAIITTVRGSRRSAMGARRRSSSSSWRFSGMVRISTGIRSAT